jgi:hypothetical protein
MSMKPHWMLLLALVVLSGCQPETEIIERTVPRVAKMQRFLGAIIYQPEATWTFKLLGPDLQVSAHKREFEQLVRSVRFADKGDITFDLPKGWGRNDKQPEGEFKRYATLELGSKEKPLEKPLECLVHQLPAIEGNLTANLVANVNRWRGQIGLYGFPEESGEWHDFVREEKIAGHSVHFIDMVGPGLSAAAAVAQRQQRPFADHPPLKKRPAELTYEAPKQWREVLPPARFSMATWEVGEGAKTASITISEVGGGVLANVNRWRVDQLGMPEIDEQTLMREMRDVPVGNRTGKMVELVNPNAKGPFNALIGVIVPGGQQDLIFRMRGPAETVMAQKASLEAFLRTVKFGE